MQRYSARVKDLLFLTSKIFIMKKIYITFLIGLLCTSAVLAQNVKFETVLPLPPEPGNMVNFIRGNGESGSGDLDGDGDTDIIIPFTRSDSLTKVYLNDGNGNFSVRTDSSFLKTVFYETIDLVDIDNDLDLDVFIRGESFSGTYVSHFYINDGNANFSLKQGTTVQGLQDGEVGFADIDNDGDLDLLITGAPYVNPVTKLYLNNGMGDYSLVSSNFVDLYGSTVEFADVDNDNDLDVLISGIYFSSYMQTYSNKLYLNNGNGSFTQSSVTFDLVWAATAKFSDIDGDNDQDILMFGIDNAKNNHVKIYTNDGTGSFTSTNAGINYLDYPSFEFVDVDGDNDDDVILIGQDTANSPVNFMYKNNNGSFSQVSSGLYPDIGRGYLKFSDVDGDGDEDLFFNGMRRKNNMTMSVGFTGLFINDGSGYFAHAKGTVLDAFIKGDFHYADVDQDNDLDLIYSGQGTFEQLYTNLYLNNGTGNYTSSSSNFRNLYFSDVCFLDIDNDNDKDIIIAGLDSTGFSFTGIYTNDGNGNFVLQSDTTFLAVHNSSIAVADVDGDNDIDVFISGKSFISYTNDVVSRLYLNNGNGDFSVSNSGFTPVHSGDTDFADIDNDNDMDLVLTGKKSSSAKVTEIYLNDGNGNFNLQTSSSITALGETVDFIDVDNDNDVDLFTTGLNQSHTTMAIMYENDGAGNFSQMLNQTFTGVSNSAVDFADVEGDGDYDIFVCGYTGDYKSVSNLYINNGSGSFSVMPTSIYNTHSGSAGFLDANGDNKKDLIVTGVPLAYNSPFIAFLYANKSCKSNFYHNENMVICENNSYTWRGNSYSYSGTYFDSLLTIDGCDSVYQLTLTVDQIDTVVIAKSICDGDSYDFMGNMLSQPGTYYHTTTSQYGCDSTTSLELTVNPKPANPLLTHNNDTLFSSSPSSNQWYHNHTLMPNASNQYHIIQQNGDYFVIISNSFGCKSDTSNIINVDWVGIPKWIDEALRVYPNPVETELSLESNMSELVFFRLVSIDGVVLKEGSFQESIVLDVERIKTSVIIVEFYVRENVKRIKLIKQ